MEQLRKSVAQQTELLSVQKQRQVLWQKKQQGKLNYQQYIELVEPFMPMLYRYCLKQLDCRYDADDVAQETIELGFRYLDSFRGDAALSTWLCAIASNQCKVVYRRRNGMKSVSSSHEVEDILGQESVLLGQLVDDVQGVLTSLPESARDILQLRFHKDMSLEEISQTLGISLSAAKMRLYRALEVFGQKYLLVAE